MNIKCRKSKEVTQIKKGEVGERMPDPGERGRIRRLLGRLARLNNSFIAAAFDGVTCSRSDSAFRWDGPLWSPLLVRASAVPELSTFFPSDFCYLLGRVPPSPPEEK